MANTGNTFLALITGAAIGAGLGVLYAPEKGEKTRKKLSKEACKARDKFEKQLKETTDHLSESAQKAKIDFESKLEDTLSSASYKAEDIISAMETKLEDLREKNAKLHREVKKEEVNTAAKKANS